jgi:hypothetical protein
MCNSMSLLSNGDGSSSKSCRLIHLGSHHVVAQFISPLSLLESQHLGGLSHTSFFLEQLPYSIAPSLATPIATSFTTPFITPLVAPSL